MHLAAGNRVSGKMEGGGGGKGEVSDKVDKVVGN